jgi:phosphatidylserine/phosphatidylglycerophosphate/cardiolipin synthase-like enzyme
VEWHILWYDFAVRPRQAAHAAGGKVMCADFTSPLIDASSDHTKTLQTFALTDLVPFTRERTYSSDASKDYHLFFVGRDDVHDILKYVISRARFSLYLNMFGYDDDELNAIIMKKVMDPTVTVVITLDKSQSNVKHEKALLDADRKHALAAFNTHFTVGQSLTHQISHTKGFVADGRVGAEGSTNWSVSGEGKDKGTFFVTGQVGGAGFKAQNNTQTIFTDSDTITRFQTELIAEHLAARDQESVTVAPEKRQRRLKIADFPKIRAAAMK